MVDGEGSVIVEEIRPDKDGKYPETVPWSKYVGIKESLGKKLDSERAKATSLEEQLKKAVNPEELSKVKAELDSTKAKLTEKETELNTNKENSLTEKRNILVKNGVPEEKAKTMSEKEIDGAMVILQLNKGVKPAPDLGGGGGSHGSLEGLSPMELALRAYSKK
jgi:hypothetical protein